MKNILKTTVLLLFVLISHTNIAQSKESYSKFKSTIQNLIDNWVDPAKAENDYNESLTWLPDLGIRGKYFANKKNLSLLKIAEIVGEPVFKSGPSIEEMNYVAGDDFGHYNPAFLTKLNKLLLKTLKDKKFVASAQKVYDAAFKNYLRCYWSSYQAVMIDIDAKKQYIETYKNLMAESSDAGFQMQQSFDELANEFETKGLDWYEFSVTATFWIRRAMHDTDDEFYILLKTVMSAFDKEYMKSGSADK